MAGISKISKQGIADTLNEISAFSRKEKEIRSLQKGSKAEETVEEGFDHLIQNLMGLKRKIKKPSTMKRTATLDLDEEAINKITNALKFFETPAKTKQKEEKMRILQGALFWEKLFGFQTLLENLQDERLKRGRKVEKVDSSEATKKRGER